MEKEYEDMNIRIDVEEQFTLYKSANKSSTSNSVEALFLSVSL